ncbi:MAG: hypothetical protein ACRD2I_06180 [Vicinamibacterales bacterium]
MAHQPPLNLLAEAVGRGICEGDVRRRRPTGAPAIGRLTGLAYPLKNGDLRSRVVEVTKSSYEFGAEWAFDPRELPTPPEDLVRVLHALIEGLAMQRILAPELCREEVFYAAFV